MTAEPRPACRRRHPGLALSLCLSLVVTAVWVVELGRLAASVPDRAQHWSVPQGEPGGLVYVALGDSAAQGIGASSPETGYVGLLAQRLRDETGQPVQVVNLSSSGARVSDVLDVQLPALAASGLLPDLVTVGIGGNDVRDYDAGRFAAEAARLVDALPPGSLVADVPYYMHGRWERDAQQAAEVMRVQTARAGLQPVALHEALRAQGWTSMLTQFAPDWFHPNDRGHRTWADAFWEQVPASGLAKVSPTRRDEGPWRRTGPPPEARGRVIHDVVPRGTPLGSQTRSPT